MNYSCEGEYNAAMSAQGEAEAQMMQEQADEIYKEVDILKLKKAEIEEKIAELLSYLP